MSVPNSVPITRLTLRDEAALRLRAEISAGVLEPGMLYPIAEIAQRLGVSITPVREALLELARDGLVEIVRNRGFRISQISDDDLDDIVQVRLLLEGPIVRALAGRLPTADAERLRELAADVEAAAAAGDLPRYLQLDRDFHLGLLAAAGNSRVVDIVARLRDETRLYGLGRLVGTPELVDTTNEHVQLLDALAAGDGDTAERIITEHVQHARGIWSGRERG